ncbi:hypothetical protein [Synechococcus sp. RSCCF101]|uniref:hypothetical protein n=1 Tax=Synechococcus sp. RSCCF101 TaxID=2511069 RepID=UPI00351A034E
MAGTVLTDRLLRSWIRCRRRPWLDRHGAPDRRRWTAHRGLLLLERQQLIESLHPAPPARGAAACAAGASAVVGVRLRGEGPAGLRLEAHPPLLLRGEGTSRWGPSPTARCSPARAGA